MAPLKEKLKELNAAHDRALVEEGRVLRETYTKLGLNTKAWQEAVALWAGFASLEEAEQHAVERGKSMLPDVGRDLRNHFINGRPEVKAVKEATQRAAEARHRVSYDQLYPLERLIGGQESNIAEAQRRIRTIQEAINKKANKTTSAAPAEEAISVQDKARLVAARQKLRSALHKHTNRQPLIDFLNARLKDNK